MIFARSHGLIKMTLKCTYLYKLLWRSGRALCFKSVGPWFEPGRYRLLRVYQQRLRLKLKVKVRVDGQKLRATRLDPPTPLTAPCKKLRNQQRFEKCVRYASSTKNANTANMYMAIIIEHI